VGEGNTVPVAVPVAVPTALAPIGGAKFLGQKGDGIASLGNTASARASTGSARFSYAENGSKSAIAAGNAIVKVTRHVRKRKAANDLSIFVVLRFGEAQA
jgi:hypothetical protein